ncbi:hypothetical protein SAMN02745945_02823 [Peptoclostridium litorale DSM 5388]|uniref:SbsA Ig-like domain-containing protein n=1 Tax=Peptoclostridium litorale DSM 5388 TaxID=1121324 RepID=A0A069RCZ3_PEPLI|nr:hypothetical protein [Peptoclostridium litorale]KDR94939.1 hypothetical protein CLIT_12c00070 [Peptoclostridium litorale DSM 5388]SIO34041.1 hypothetical protein SAMN02745945_02823 [Peptoclostridium litorale DSM 5388]
MSFKLKKFMTALIAAIMIFTVPCSTFAADMAEQLKSQYGYEMRDGIVKVSKSKEFNIVFSKDIDAYALGGIQIFEKTKSILVETVTSAEGKNKLKVSPVLELQKGSSYYLIIHSPEVAADSIRSSSGDALQTGTICEFFVQGEYIGGASAEGSIATAITGNVHEADRIEVEYDGNIKSPEIINGEFSWNVFPGLSNGTKVKVRAYKGGTLLEEIEIESE